MIDQILIDKSETSPVDLYKLSNVVEKKVVKRNLCDELVKEVNAIHTNDTSNLVKKADYNIEIDEIEKAVPDHHKCITTLEFYKLTLINLAARIKQTDLASKNDIAHFAKKSRN